jgi:hypothetical protein
MTEKVVVPDKVYNQLETLRQSGQVNMFTEVKRGLDEMGFTEALNWVEDNPDKYVEGFEKGLVPESEA